MKQNNNDNAANRFSYVGHVYEIGESTIKTKILESLPKKWASLHRNGYIHIHDLDAYGLTYNCLTFDFDHLDLSEINDETEQGRIISLFSYLKLLIEDYGNEQSGGMAFPNFDNDVDGMLEKLNVANTKENNFILRSCIRAFIRFCNDNHTRMGLVSYYVTLNIGLADTERARFIAKTVLEEFESLGDMVYKPNIVFKVCDDINRNEGDPNYDILKQALLCTAKKMIPTYLLCDCEQNKQTDPSRLSIMGCRTRVVDDVYGAKGAIGRGNIDNISINLPHLALEIDRDYRNSSFEDKLQTLRKRWTDIAEQVKDILIDRYKKVIGQPLENFPTNFRFNLWGTRFDGATNLEEIFKHGTLSLGFIGLSEAIEVLSGKKYYSDPSTLIATVGFVSYMREYCDFLRRETKLNFSLLATSGELISGRFTEIDKKEFTPVVDIFSKGYYTNSFHVDVDSRLPARKKIQIEGLFHPFCNGGSITYVELGEAPIGNDEGLRELLEIAISANVHYLGFNFPKDICKECGTNGVFDTCPCCGSGKITRIRRVSGYLEILDGFTKGKKFEEQNRRKNDYGQTKHSY